MFSKLRELGIENTVYVPVSMRAGVPPQEEHVIVSNRFTQLDRVLFYAKQRKMLQDLQGNVDLSAVDVIHAHTVFSGGYAALQLHRRYGTPYIVAFRNTDLNVFFKYMIHLRRTGVEIMRNAEKVVFLSPAYQEHLLSQYVSASDQDRLRQKSVIIPNGISPLFFKDTPSSRIGPGVPPRLIYVGEVNSNKNLETTVKAVEQLRQQGINIYLTVVGAVQEEKYRSLIEKKADFITHYPPCPQEEVLKHLRSADIFVMPSHTESFGLVYAEAMSQGLPVLYTRGQGFDGQFPDGTVGYAVSDRDPLDLEKKIRLVMERYGELSENCIKLVGKFDWEKITAQYQTIYQECKRERGI